MGDLTAKEFTNRELWLAVFGAAVVRESYDHAKMFGVESMIDRMPSSVEEAETVATLAVEAVGRG